MEKRIEQEKRKTNLVKTFLDEDKLVNFIINEILKDNFNGKN